jgi:hypothetical protein
LAQQYGGDENATGAARELRKAQLELDRGRKEVHEQRNALAQKGLDIIAATFHSHNGVPLEVLENLKSAEAVEAAAYRWLYENPAEKTEATETVEETKEDYESGVSTRRGKSIASMTPDEVADMTDKQLKPGFMKSLAGQPR